MNGVCDTSHYPKEGPWVLPEGWVWCRIDEMGEVVTGTTPSKSDTSNYGSDYPFYKPTDLECGLSTSTAGDNLSAKGFERTRQLPINSVLVTCIGATIGKTGLIRKAGSCNQQINAIIPYASLIDPEYLYYCCASGYGQDTIISRASATTLPILNKSKFSEILFPLPPFSEQHRILRVIQKYLVIIGTIESENTELDKLIQTSKDKILELAIHGKLVPQYSTDEPAIETLKRINPAFKPSDNLHYEDCPTGWVIVTFKDIISLYSGRDLEASHCNSEHRGLPYLVGASCIEGQSISIYRWTDYPEVISQKDDILLSCKGTVGEVILNTLGDVHIARQFMAIRSKSSQLIIPRYIELIIKASVEKLKSTARGIIPGISREDILEMDVAIPPVAEQRRILSRINEIEQSLSIISLNTSE